MLAMLDGNVQISIYNWLINHYGCTRVLSRHHYLMAAAKNVMLICTDDAVVVVFSKHQVEYMTMNDIETFFPNRYIVKFADPKFVSKIDYFVDFEP